MYDLPLKLPIGYFESVDLTVSNPLKEALESIQDVRERLIYFNKNIRSLAAYSYGRKVYYQWGRPDDIIEVYCGCGNCQTWRESSPHEQFYLSLQREEAQRIKAGLRAQKDYKSKLEFLYSVRGYYPGCEVKVYSSEGFCKNADPDEGGCNEEPLVDLTPETQEQLEIYNEFILAAFNKKFKNQNEFSDAYKGFRFQKEKVRFEQDLRCSFDPEKLIEYRTAEIGKTMKYPQSVGEPLSQEPYLKEIQNMLVASGLNDNMFNQIMLVGSELNMESYILNERAILNHTHHVEIAEFYKYLKQLSTTESATVVKETISKPGMLISGDNEFKPEPTSKFSIPTYALFHVYLSLFQGQGVTQQNKNELVKKYGYTSGAQLRNEFTRYFDEDRRMTLNTTSKTSAETHLLRFKNILPMLKEVNFDAFEQAEKDLRILKQQYKKHFS